MRLFQDERHYQLCLQSSESIRPTCTMPRPVKGNKTTKTCSTPKVSSVQGQSTITHSRRTRSVRSRPSRKFLPPQENYHSLELTLQWKNTRCPRSSCTYLVLSTSCFSRIHLSLYGTQDGQQMYENSALATVCTCDTAAGITFVCRSLLKRLQFCSFAIVECTRPLPQRNPWRSRHSA